MSVVAVVGLGYVGLPLVVEFGKQGRTIGFDIVEQKVERCRAGKDPSREIPDEEMRAAVHAEYTCDASELREADVIIVAVPIGVVFGLLFGIAAWRWRAFGRTLSPLLDLMQTIPVFAISWGP